MQNGKNSRSNLILSEGTLMTVGIKPRWPQKNVVLSEVTLFALQDAQKNLNNNIRLIVTRGYQLENVGLKYCRKLGGIAFKFLYPARRFEVTEIFTCNGHSLDGYHVDVSIEYNGNTINFLPFSVFTPLWLTRKLTFKYKTIIQQVHSVLADAGFKIHNNAIEALQIHCDLEK